MRGRPVGIPRWLPWLSGAAGLWLMLVALGVVGIPVENVRAPRAVLFAAGLMFALAAVVLKLIPTRHEHPARYLFFCALLCSAFFCVGAWSALFATGIQGSAGPMRFSGPATDSVGRAIFGLGALLLAFLSGLAWYKWWRALRGHPVDLD